MSTPEEPPQLTRRQLRELRNTAATPIISETAADTPPPSEAGSAVNDRPSADGPRVEAAEDAARAREESGERSSEPRAPAPLPRAAEPVDLPEPPTVEVDGPTAGAGEPRTLTRREIRQRERLRTASVPVITADVLAAAQSGVGDDWSDPASRADDGPEPSAPSEIIEAVPLNDSEPSAAAGDDALSATTATAPEPEPEPEPVELVVTGSTPVDEAAGIAESEPSEPAESDASSRGNEADSAEERGRRVVTPELGADVLRGQLDVEVPASFDQLLTRGSATGALSMPNALILSQTPDGGPLTAPVAATGEILITGTFALPDHYGATGTVPGRADGKEADAALVDGELPASSSPTPIAASAAISTIKSADEIIKPPAPERGSRLMVVLAITAGVLAVALAGVLILAITTGIFS